MALSSRLLAACSAALLLVSASVPVDAALNVNMKLASSRVALSSDALELAVMVTPKQPKLKQLSLETLVDTSGATVLSDLKLKGDGSKFVTKLKGDNTLQAGMYKLKVSAVDEESKESAYEVLQLKVTTPVEATGAVANGKKLKVGDKLTGQSFNAAVEDTLKLEVNLQQAHDKTPVVAHQAFLRFTHATEKTETYFVLTANAGLTHSTTLQFAALSKKFGYNSGKHHLELILGASTFEKAIVWDLGNVELQLGAAPPETPSPLYKKHLLYESDTTLKALPEIKHVMREQDPRPPVVVSLAFMGAVLVPLLFFLLFVARLGLNMKRLFEGSVFVFGCVFLVSLGGILALFGLYWLELTMFRTLGYLSILGSVNLWSGHLTLKRLAESPAKKTTKVE
ncbi:Dolichyl-diphosphooligosaccharide--protein glycosyltransferase subunit 2 [Phytophthora citrophthora]|uniref:Ribophorin II n=1 Tax=Phytophthora citrophthora TaxID=4793 RepID=A0AAD9GWK0_9STRA|nr:Dolichyl-diphosphooligosaccharide--protein glycosyltransferase subunit 2 [Phytophthora citrophthora]